MEDFGNIRVHLRHSQISWTMEFIRNAWERHIVRLRSEMFEPVSNSTWGAHDYFAALNLRDFFARGQEGLSRSQQEAAVEYIADPDRMLRDMTEHDTEGLVVYYGEPSLDGLEDRWWWYRIPTAGLVRTELFEWHERASNSGS